MNKIRRLSALLAIGGVCVIGTGCAGNDIVFEGKVFEVLGVDSLNSKKVEPKVKQRAPLVLPPQAKLPEPGKRVAVQQIYEWPDDPDERRKAQQAALAKHKKEVCPDLIYDRNHPLFDEEKYNLCQSAISKALGNLLGTQKSDDDTEY